MNFQPSPQEHAKLPGDLVSNERQITCRESHILSPVNNLKQLHQDTSGTYSYNMFVCDTCRRKYTCSKSTSSHHCSTCKFDMCSACYEDQKTIKISCPKSHPLFSVTALKAFANYASNTYRCNSCFADLDAGRSPAAHCLTCNYDLCPKCIANGQSQQQQVNPPQEQEHAKRSGNPSSIPDRQVTCLDNHVLSPVNNLKNLHPDTSGTYAYNMFVCDTCRRKYTCSASTASHHCSTCKFDMCSACHEAQKMVKISCPRSHPLFSVTALKAFANYTSDIYRCNSCFANLNAAQNPAAHCKTCNYDLCPKCVTNQQDFQPSRQEKEDIKKPGNPSAAGRQITCRENHTLSPVNNLKQLHQDTSGTYAYNMFVCDTCRRKYTCSASTSSHHCSTCKFDMCSACYEDQKTIRILCPRSHALFRATALKAFANYASNTYRCNSCLSSLDAAQNPAAHCLTCNYDLCPKCLENNQIDIPKEQFNDNNQFQNIQQNHPQQDNNQQSWILQTDYQFKMPQNFANLVIQEPIKQVVPQQKPEEAKNDQPEAEKKDLPDEMLCVLCLSVQRSHLFTPCMHLCTCGPCSTDLVNKQKDCPMCRAPIQSSVKVFMS